MRSKLEMPLQLARVERERHYARRVQIVAGAHVAVPSRTRVAGSPVDQIQLRVVGAGDPGGAAASLPGVACPGFRAGLAGRGDRVEAPRSAACGGVIRVDETANAVLTSGDTH